jgi:hypothetical protein
MKAEITYNGARSYLVGGVKFIDGVTRTVTDPALIERCKVTAGFAVHVLKEKVVREVATHDRPRAVPDEVEPVAKRKAKAMKSE